EVGVMYIPQSQVPQGITTLAATVLPLSWAIRTKGDPSGLRAAVEREIRSLDRVIAVTQQRAMDQGIAEALARQNSKIVLLAISAGIALLLAAIGIYGLMAYSVEQRTQEIGIRMALGAVRGDMLKLILIQGAKLALAGVALGTVLAYGLTRLLANLLFGVKAADVPTFVVLAAVSTAFALLAQCMPARRAYAMEPCDALRHS